jgi:gentisate 1,2-dioxygenase
LLTPNWSWHGHSNESDACAYWIDVLDVPLVHFLEPMFFEPLAERFIEAAEEIDAASPMRFPWAQTAARLDMEVEIAPGHRRIELGPPALDTMALFVSRLAAGSRFVGGRTTANSIFAAIGGRGTAAIDGRHFAWGRGDIFAVPAWRPHEIAALEDSHLLRVTDEPLLSRLNWLRREP